MYDGVEINLLTRPGPVIAGRLEERGKEYTEMTGAEVNVAEVPFADLFQKLLTDWATGTNSIDVGVFASGWAVELVDGGLLADLSDFVAKDTELEVEDIAPYFREFNQKIDGKTYLITDRWRLPDGLLPHATCWTSSGSSRRRPGTSISRSPPPPTART